MRPKTSRMYSTTTMGTNQGGRMTFEQWFKKQHWATPFTADDLIMIQAAWYARQPEINELRDVLNIVVDHCEKNLQYWDGYDDLMVRVWEIR